MGSAEAGGRVVRGVCQSHCTRTPIRAARDARVAATPASNSNSNSSSHSRSRSRSNSSSSSSYDPNPGCYIPTSHPSTYLAGAGAYLCRYEGTSSQYLGTLRTCRGQGGLEVPGLGKSCIFWVHDTGRHRHELSVPIFRRAYRTRRLGGRRRDACRSTLAQKYAHVNGPLAPGGQWHCWWPSHARWPALDVAAGVGGSSRHGQGRAV